MFSLSLLNGNGFYLIANDGSKAFGPYPDIRALCIGESLTDYPADGYIYTFDGQVLGGVPSLNPDDLVSYDDE